MRPAVVFALLAPLLASATPVALSAQASNIAIQSITVSGDSKCNGNTRDIALDFKSMTVGFDAFASDGGLVQCTIDVSFTYTPTSGTTSVKAQMATHGFGTLASGQTGTMGQSIWGQKSEKKLSGQTQDVVISSTASSTFDGKGSGKFSVIAYVSVPTGGQSIAIVDSVDIALS